MITKHPSFYIHWEPWSISQREPITRPLLAPAGLFARRAACGRTDRPQCFGSILIGVPSSRSRWKLNFLLLLPLSTRRSKLMSRSTVGLSLAGGQKVLSRRFAQRYRQWTCQSVRSLSTSELTALRRRPNSESVPIAATSGFAQTGTAKRRGRPAAALWLGSVGL